LYGFQPAKLPNLHFFVTDSLGASAICFPRQQQMSGIFAVFTPDCVSFCEVSSHAANSKGRRLRFLGSHRRIVMLFYLILFAPDSFRNLFNQLELVPLLQPGQLVARSRRSQNHTAGSGRGGPLFCFVDAGNHGVLMQKTA
jgi:hypothetical protein